MSKRPSFSRQLVLMNITAIPLVAFLLFYMGTQASTNEQIILGAILLILLSPLLRVPLNVNETNDSIIIRQIIGQKVFDKKQYDIKTVQLSSSGLFSTLRCFGSAIWVFWGYFWDKNIGGYFAQHVGDRNLLLLIRKRDGKKYLIDQPA